MPLLSPEDTKYLHEMFQQQLTGDVTITLFTQKQSLLLVPGQEPLQESCKQANEIVAEVAVLSDKIHVEIYDVKADGDQFRTRGVERIPAILLGSGDRRPARFFGVTSGYEFSTLVQDIIDISTENLELTEETLQWARDLKDDVPLQVFTTPT